MKFFKIIIFLILVLYIKNIKEKYTNIWAHLEEQPEEYLRIASPNNDLHIVKIDMFKLNKTDIKWDWNLSHIFVTNPYPSIIKFIKLENILLGNDHVSISKTHTDNYPDWVFLGDNPHTNTKEIINPFTHNARNQYTQPTCVAFVLCELMSAYYRKKKFSPRFIFYWIKKLEKDNLKWSSIRWNKSKRGLNKPTLLWRGIEVLSTKGLVLENDIPYIDKQINYPLDLRKSYLENPDILSKSEEYRVKSGSVIYLYRNSISGKNNNPIKYLIHMLVNGPVGITVVLKKQSFYSNINWKIRDNHLFNIEYVVADSDEKSLSDAHAIILYGYSNNIKFISGNRKYVGGFVFKNSWGEWGTQGYAWITFDYVSLYLYEAVQLLI